MDAAKVLAFVAIGIAMVLGGCGGESGSDGASQNQAPVASFVATPDGGPAPLQVQFDASASRDPDGSLTSYSWNFGDSTPVALGVTASHIFRAAGTYTVTLTVLDSGGGSASATRQLTVQEPTAASVKVPDTVGQTEADATTAITSVGLLVGQISRVANESTPAGRVIAQSPVAGELVARQSNVDLVISSGRAGPSAGDFSLIVEPAAVDIPRGSGATLKLTITRTQDFSEPVSVTLDQPPTGIEAGTMTFSGSVSRGFLLISVDETAPLGASPLKLLGTAAGSQGSVSMTLTVSAVAPTAQEKIAAGLKSGALDYGTSLLYRAYALHGDRRLPDVYVGAGSVEEDNGLFLEIGRAMPSLPPDTQASLHPFIVRPADAESVWSAKSSSAPAVKKLQLRYTAREATSPGPLCPPASDAWISARSATYAVRVWAKCSGDDYYNSESQHLLERTLGILDKIYSSMTELMGEPVPDLEGGDDAIDFYVVDPEEYVFRRSDAFAVYPKSWATTYVDYPVLNGGSSSSSFVLLSRSTVYWRTFHSIVIHEFFHVLQNRYNYRISSRPSAVASNVEDPYWFTEASAVWAAVHFDRVLAPWPDGRAAYEHDHVRFLRTFLPNTNLSLNTGYPPFSKRSYGAYIWPYFVEQEMQEALGASNAPGAVEFMARIWDGLASVGTNWELGDNIIDGQYSFAKNFRKFALRNLNRAFRPGDPLPVEKRYVSLDNLFPDSEEDGAEDDPRGLLPKEVSADLVPDQEFRHAVTLNNLSADYVRLHADYSGLRKVTLDFSALVPIDLLDVMALIRTERGWISVPFDYSDESTLTFCFDNGPTTQRLRGSFEEMVLVLANHAMTADNKVTGNLIVRPSLTACESFYSGTVHRTFAFESATGDVHRSETHAAVMLGTHDETIWPCPNGGTYCVRNGSIQFDSVHDDHSSGCHTTVTAAGPILPPKDSDGTGWIEGAGNSWLYIYTDPADGLRYYSADGDLVLTATYERTGCNNENDNYAPREFWESIIWWKSDPQLLPNDGRSIVGVFDQDLSILGTGTGFVHYEWSLDRVAE